jgi:hypothetical protein
LQEEAGRYPDLEYCKADLIASKGVVFFKYAKASSALRALEDIAAKGLVGGGAVLGGGGEGMCAEGRLGGVPVWREVRVASIDSWWVGH